MSLENKLIEDLKHAMKTKDELATSVLRMLKSQLMLEKTRKDGSKKLSDEKVQQVFASYAKKLADAVEQFDKGGRDDLVAQNKTQADILATYLPAEMTDEELKKAIDKIIAENKEIYDKKPQAVIGIAMKKLSSQADPQRILNELNSRQ